ncbi:MAG: response regulator [Verrucomicrobiota bacterium]|nr:response regulator [Verrucomicrobiota bacterium]
MKANCENEMLDQEDLKWIAITSTELNSMLQQISRYSDLARQHKGQYNYIEMLAERVEVASKKAQTLFDRVTSSILDRCNQPGAAPSLTFSVVRPLSIPEPTAAAIPATSAEKKAPAGFFFDSSTTPVEICILNPRGKRELILLIDDDKEISELAGTMLTDEGYRVILAKDGFEALRVYQQIGKEIGLVILDFFLPIMDGDAVFDELRALNPEISVVLSSGFAEQGKLAAMLGLGLRGFIPKPYTSAKLLAQVRSILDSGRDNQA